MPASLERLPTWTVAALMVLLLASAVPTHAQTAAGGLGHSAVVHSDGTLWVWGANNQGQLGDGTVVPSLTPVQVQGPTNVVAVASGDGHLLALTSTGVVWAWGANASGQVGDGTNTDRLVPLAVLTGAVGIDAGPDFSLAWKADGSLWTWGANTTGQLGDGTQLPSNTPASISGVIGVTQASAGQGHCIALASAGALWSWGVNGSGQLGDGTQQTQLSPVAATVVPDAVQVVAGFGASYALRSAGTLWAWGDNQYGQLGDGTTTSRLTAATISVPATVQTVSAGGGHVVTRHTDGTVRSWGRNDYGQVGDGTQTNRLSPYALAFADAAAASAGDRHSLAVTSTGVVWAWGRNDQGQLGDGTTEDRLVPVAISGSAFSWKAGRPVLAPPGGTYETTQNVTATSATSGASIQYTTDGTDPDELSPSVPSGGSIAIGETTTLKAHAVEALHTPSDVVTEGYTLQVPAVTFAPPGGSYTSAQSVTLSSGPGASIYFTDDGSDPDETSTPYTGAVDVSESVTLKARAYDLNWEPSAISSTNYDISAGMGAVSGGEGFSLAIVPSGDVWAWGRNNQGQLGDGTTTLRTVPGQVSGLRSIVAIAAGFEHGLALTDTGYLYAWGANTYGQLGDGTTTRQTVPVPVLGLSNVSSVGAGNDFSVALLDDGTLYAWGWNNYGQLGQGDKVNRTSPTQVLTGVEEFAVGKYHVVARMSDGTLKAWGYNGYGRLGDGTTTTRTSPVAVTGLSSVTHVAAGYLDTLATLGDGSVYAWGWNSDGAVGDGTTTHRYTPTAVVGLTSPSMLEGGGEHSLAVGSAAGAWAWGENYDGELGDGTNTDRHVPTAVADLTDVIRVSGGWHHSLAVTSDGSVYAWGNNQYGQVGDGTTVDRNTPVKVLDAGGVGVATPSFDPSGGSFTAEQTVTVDVATPGASIHYTTNGVDPTTSDPQITPGSTVLVDQGLTLKARAFKSGMTDSSVATAVFTLTVPTPSVSVGTGTYDQPQTVTVSCGITGSDIHYTTNGADPTQSDAVIASGGTVLIDDTQTFKAKAWRAGWVESAIRTATYTMKVASPVLAPGGGMYSVGQGVTVSTVTPGAILSYTIDGREPGPADPAVASGGTLTLDRSLTLRVKGHRYGWSDSPVASEGYFLTSGTAGTPALSPAPGTYAGEQLVTLTSSTPGAVIRYTLDGSEPPVDSAQYMGPVLVDTTLTLKAKAFKTEFAPSATASGAYTISSPGAVSTPTFLPAPGAYATGQSVTIASATPGSTLRYTVTGVDPTTSDAAITSGASVVLDRTTSLKAKGWKDGLGESAVRSGMYVVTGSLAAGSNFILALKADGTVVAWGANTYGTLGDGTTTSSDTPVVATGLSDIVAVAAGKRHSVALDRTGHVFCWGDNWKGQLGDGTTTDSLVPQQVPGLTGVAAIAAGAFHTLAVKTDGTIMAWGENDSRQLGDGTNITRTSPVAVTGLTGVVAVAGGGSHSLAVTTDGQVWSWGYNSSGQLGDGTTTLRATPVLVPGLSGVTGVWAGDTFSLALKTDGLDAGSLWGWGSNNNGQIGTGDGTARHSPAFITDGVTAAAAGPLHSLVTKQDGSLWAWGAGGGYFGRLGDGSETDRFAPAQVWGLRDVVVVVGGDVYSAAVRADGTVLTWGYNLGDTYSNTPIVTPDLSLVDNAWLADDFDGDGLSAWGEWQAGCDPLRADTNGDGLSDGTSVGLGLSCSSPDLDEDGVLNSEELLLGTSPWLSDTDSDGTTDGADCAPLDPTTTSCPVNPNDHTPPVITLVEPPNATPLP